MTTDPTTGPQIVSGDYDEAGVNYDAMLREIESLRSQLAEAREQRDQAAEALVRAETERDEARAEIARLERAAHEQGADLWIAEDRLDWLCKRVRLAMDLLCSPTVPHEKGPDVPSAYGILSHALAATAPETGLSAPQTDEQAQVRGESHTDPQTGSDGPLTPAWCRTQMQRLCIAASESGLRWRDYDVVGAVIAEIDRLRTEVKQLSARVREWEAVNADLAARCDSGDIPIRLGERYSQAVLREIDRLRELANDASELGITDTDQPASARVDLVIGLRQRGVPQHPDGPEAAALAEIDRLRTILRESGDHRG